MDWEAAVQFLAEASIALMEPDLDRSLARLQEIADRQDWLSFFCLRGRAADGSDIQVRAGEMASVADCAAVAAGTKDAAGATDSGSRATAEGAENRDDDRVELIGTREGVPVSLVAYLRARPGAGDGSGNRDVVFRRVMGQILRMFAKRLSVQYAVTRVRERELADAVGALSHDFRTPLACIKGYVSLLAGGRHPPGTPEWDEYLGTVLEECERLERLVSVVLESAVEPQVSLSMEPVLLPPLVKRVLLEESAIAKEHRFFTDISPEAREIFADPTRLEQVLRNLFDNAIKYSPEGSLIVLRVKKTGEEFLFSVADQGGGIAPEHLNRLFERHYRVTGGGTGEVQGTGLGLLIARQIVNAHGGDIWAESIVGKGSTFYFTIPCPKDRTFGKEVNE